MIDDDFKLIYTDFIKDQRHNSETELSSHVQSISKMFELLLYFLSYRINKGNFKVSDIC